MKDLTEVLIQRKAYDQVIQKVVDLAGYDDKMEKGVLSYLLTETLDNEIRNAAQIIFNRYLIDDEESRGLLERVLAQNEIDEIVANFRG